MLVHWVQLYFFMYIHSDRQSATGIRKGAQDLKHRSRDEEPSVARNKKQSSAKPEDQASGALEAATATHRQKIDYRLFARDETTATAL